MASCASEPKSINDNVILMPYFDSSGYSSGEFGYVNAETLEIVIPMQYNSAGPFIGDFAWVTKWNNAQRKDPYFIINKSNNKILGGLNFDRVTLFETGDRNQIFALTGKYIIENQLPRWPPELWFFWFLSPFFIEREHTRTKHQLYNLNTGSLVLSKTHPERHEPKIELFSNYIQYDDELYEIQKNGRLKKINAELATAIIAQEKQTPELDLEMVVHNLPEGFRLEPGHGLKTWNMGDNWFERIKEIYEIRRPISQTGYRHYQVDRFKAGLYQIDLVDRTGEKFAALYDALQNKWAIPPIKAERYFDFYFTGYHDWICYYNGVTWKFPEFYNIKTGKKYQYQYGMMANWAMTYMGHNLNKSNRYYHSEFIEEEFCDD